MGLNQLLIRGGGCSLLFSASSHIVHPPKGVVACKIPSTVVPQSTDPIAIVTGLVVDGVLVVDVDVTTMFSYQVHSKIYISHLKIYNNFGVH